MLRKTLFAATGLAFALAYFALQADLLLRAVVASIFQDHSWLQATVFFTLPVVTHLVAGRLLSRIPCGTWMVGGWLGGNLWLLTLNYDNYFYPARAFGGCGNGVHAWFNAIYLLPSVCGLTLALLRLGRGQTLPAGPGERQMAVTVEDMAVAVAGEDLAEGRAVPRLV